MKILTSVAKTRFFSFSPLGVRLYTAFSVIELLVAITVIAIMVTLGLGVFGMASKSARSVKDLGQLKQIGLAHALYMDDHNHIVAPGVVPSTNQVWFNGLLRPYFKIPLDSGIAPIFISPSDPAKGGAATLAPIHQRSYAINSHTLDSKQNPISILKCENPARMFYMINYEVSKLMTNWCDDTDFKLQYVPDDWHLNKTVHLLFLDAHVEAIRKEDLYPGKPRNSVFGPIL